MRSFPLELFELFEENAVNCGAEDALAGADSIAIDLMSTIAAIMKLDAIFWCIAVPSLQLFRDRFRVIGMMQYCRFVSAGRDCGASEHDAFSRFDGFGTARRKIVPIRLFRLFAGTGKGIGFNERH